MSDSSDSGLQNVLLSSTSIVSNVLASLAFWQASNFSSNAARGRGRS